MGENRKRTRINMLILSVLNRKDAHGYEIIKTINGLSEEEFSLQAGNLYPILHEMELEGMVEAYWEGETRKRKVYRITEKGKLELQKERRKWERYKRAVERILWEG